MNTPDPYRVLGVDRDATPEEIRTAFRRAVRRAHPDTASGARNGAGAREVIAAYRLLIDPATRTHYDAVHGEPERRQVSVRRGGASAPTAAGRPTSRCRRCRGAGVVRSDVVCPACEGRAEITVLGGRRSEVRRCRRCAGVGRVARLTTCVSCRGSGLEPSS